MFTQSPNSASLGVSQKLSRARCFPCSMAKRDKRGELAAHLLAIDVYLRRMPTCICVNAHTSLSAFRSSRSSSISIGICWFKKDTKDTKDTRNPDLPSSGPGLTQISTRIARRRNVEIFSQTAALDMQSRNSRFFTPTSTNLSMYLERIVFIYWHGRGFEWK